jgi:hypothetical protein
MIVLRMTSNSDLHLMGALTPNEERALVTSMNMLVDLLLLWIDCVR